MNESIVVDTGRFVISGQNHVTHFEIYGRIVTAQVIKLMAQEMR